MPKHVYEFKSWIKGYHAYQDVWSPVIGEDLACEREPENTFSPGGHAVAVKKGDDVVGHVPCENERLC